MKRALPPILVLRPEPGASQTAARLAEIGLTPLIMPLFEIRPVDWTVPDPDRFDALALSSANAVRHGGAGLDRLKTLPIYAVGKTTAGVAQEAGFQVAGVGSGGIEGLAPLLERDARGSILRLVGQDFITFDPPAITVETIPVYAAVDSEPDASLTEALHDGGAVALLYSVRAARRFARLCDRHAAKRDTVSVVAISSAVAAAAGTGWADVGQARAPDEASLLSALQNMLEAHSPISPRRNDL